MNYLVTFLLGIISAMLIDNVVLSRFYGICPFLGVSNKPKSAVGMGFAVVFVIVIASAVCWPLYRLLELAQIPFMDTVVYILVIASLVQLVGLFIKKYSPSLYKALGIYLPLITTNCAVLGVALTNVQKEYDFVTSVVNDKLFKIPNNIAVMKFKFLSKILFLKNLLSSSFKKDSL